MQLYRTDERATMYHVIAFLHFLGLILWTLALVYYWAGDGFPRNQRPSGRWIFSSIVPLNM